MVPSDNLANLNNFNPSLQRHSGDRSGTFSQESILKILLDCFCMCYSFPTNFFRSQCPSPQKLYLQKWTEICDSGERYTNTFVLVVFNVIWGSSIIPCTFIKIKIIHFFYLAVRHIPNLFLSYLTGGQAQHQDPWASCFFFFRTHEIM